MFIKNSVNNYIYTSDSIRNLQNEVSKKVAGFANREVKNRKYDLGEIYNEEIPIKLTYYNNLLERVLHCDSCFKGFESQDIVSIIKSSLNKI